MSLINTASLVTGAAKRVGRAIALDLARAGCDVAVHCHTSRSLGEEVAAAVRAIGRNAEVVTGDLNEPRCWRHIVEEAVEKLGRLDVLVNNASVFSAEGTDSIDTFEPTVWERVLRVNLTAQIGLVHHARTYLEASGRGCVINLTDIAAERPGQAHLAYCASKAGLVAMTRALARALAPNVRVNAVAPGIAVFPDDYSDHVREQLVAQVPLRREGSPEEVARLVRFLVETGDYVTGQVIAIDGGRSVCP